MKRTNKGVQPEYGQPPAEFMERRPPAKGNPGQTTMTGTQRPDVASSGLDRVREAAKRDKELRFTNLLHHVTVEWLESAYRRLNPKAVSGIDEVTWTEYGEGLQERLAALLDRIHGGTCRARPSKRVWIRNALEAFRTQIGHAWLRALRRRSPKGRNLTRQRMQGWVERWIPRARVLHPYPNQRLCV